MTQNWTENVFQADHVVQTDMQNIENNMLSIKTLFAGSSHPGNGGVTLAAGVPWYKTTTYLGWRGYTGSAWEKLLQGDANHKVWSYVGTAGEGWRIDTSVTDVVLALKGGSQAYNVSGGNQAGSWDMSGALSNANASSHTHSFSDTSSAPSAADGNSGVGTDGAFQYGDATHTHTVSGTTGAGGIHTHVISSDNTDRPRAAVGILIYPELR